MCIPITVTAIKINLTLYVLSAAYGHSLTYFLEHIAVSLLRSKSQHFSFFVGDCFMFCNPQSLRDSSFQKELFAVLASEFE